MIQLTLLWTTIKKKMLIELALLKAMFRTKLMIKLALLKVMNKMKGNCCVIVSDLSKGAQDVRGLFPPVSEKSRIWLFRVMDA